VLWYLLWYTQKLPTLFKNPLLDCVYHFRASISIASKLWTKKKYQNHLTFVGVRHATRHEKQKQKQTRLGKGSNPFSPRQIGKQKETLTKMELSFFSVKNNRKCTFSCSIF